MFSSRTINNFIPYPLHSDKNDSFLALKLPKNLSHFFNELDSFSSDINDTSENLQILLYYIHQLSTLKEFNDKISFSFSSNNSSSLKIFENNFFK